MKQTWNLLAKYGHDQAGAAAIVLAVVFPVLVGFIAVGAEIGYWYLNQRKIQHIADVSAYTAVVRLNAGNTKAEIDTATDTNAAASGFEPASMTLAVSTPPLTGGYAGATGFAEVTVESTIPRYFSGIYAAGDVVVHARAVAGLGEGFPVCMLALSHTASGAVTSGGSSVAQFEGCSVASNSIAPDSFLMNGGSVAVTAGCVDTVGGVSVTSGLTLTDCAAPRTMQPPIVDPYADLSVPVVTGTPQTINQVMNQTLTPVESHPLGIPLLRLSGGTSLKGNVTLDPGLYIIDGGSLDITANSAISGTNVAIFLANGATLKVAGSAELNLSARTSAPLSGLLFFSDPNDVQTSHIFAGNAASNIDGVIYLPNGVFSYTGSSGTSTSCLQILADQISMTGNSDITMNCTPTGGKQILADRVVRLYE